MPYAEAQKRGYRPEDMVPLKPRKSQKLRDQVDTATATVHSFNRYQGHIHDYAPKLTDADRSAMGVLTSHQDKIAQGFLTEIQSGAIDTLIGQPMTGYSQKLMGAAMTKDQYDKLSPEGKQLLADYFNAVIQNFGNMKQILGSLGRNPMQLQAEINTIPLPYLDPQSADAAFRDKLEDIQTRNRSLPSFYGQTEQPTQGELNPPKEADKGMKWQHRTVNGKTEWRQVEQ